MIIAKVRRAPGSPATDAPSTYGGSYSYANRRQYSGACFRQGSMDARHPWPDVDSDLSGLPHEQSQLFGHVQFKQLRSRVYSSSNGMVSEGNFTRPRRRSIQSRMIHANDLETKTPSTPRCCGTLAQGVLHFMGAATVCAAAAGFLGRYHWYKWKISIKS